MASSWVELPGNLSPHAASKRLRSGVIMLAIGLALGVVLVKSDLPIAYRALLFLPFFMTANGFYQGLYRT
ncbi:MAG: hypothetical protein KC731_42635 [Myxococcales bacterium]|nr:hypothetical protein [Myxococcales bacterium]